MSSRGEILQKQGVLRLGLRHIVAVCVHGQTHVLVPPSDGVFDESCDWDYDQVESDTSQQMSDEFMPRGRLQACDKDEDVGADGILRGSSDTWSSTSIRMSFATWRGRFFHMETANSRCKHDHVVSERATELNHVSLRKQKKKKLFSMMSMIFNLSAGGRQGDCPEIIGIIGKKQ